MSKARFCLLPDTGLYHLAVGVGSPIFALFTHTNPELVRPEIGIYELAFRVDESKGLDPFGLPYGTNDLNVDELFAQASGLIRRIKENETLV
jgi:ADP-heptose:LPS heptosyltransferase